MTKIEAAWILGVVPDATESEIKARYRKLARENHPDSVDQKDAAAVDAAKQKAALITRAYGVMVGKIIDDKPTVRVAGEAGVTGSRSAAVDEALKDMDTYLNGAARLGKAVGIGVVAAAKGHGGTAIKAARFVLVQGEDVAKAIDRIEEGAIGQIAKGVTEIARGIFGREKKKR